MDPENKTPETPSSSAPAPQAPAVTTADALRALGSNLHLGWLVRLVQWLAGLPPVHWTWCKTAAVLRWTFRNKTIRWSTAVLGLLVLLALLMLAVWNWRAGIRLEHKLAEVQALGGPVLPYELQQAYTAYVQGLGDRNGARYYNAVFAFLPGPQSKDPEALPFVGQGRKPLPGENLDPGIREQAAAYLQNCNGMFEIVAKAQEMDGCVFELNYNDGGGMLLPHLSKLRNLVRHLALRSQVQAEEGDTAGAVTTVCQNFRLADSLDHEAILISMLVRANIQNQALDQLECLLAHGPLTAVQLQALDQAIAAALDQDFQQYWRGERSFGIWAFSKILSGEVDIQSLAGNNPGMFEKTMTGLLSNLVGGSLKDQYVEYLDYMTFLIETAGRPFREARIAMAERAAAFENTYAHGGMIYRFNHIMLGMLLPVIGRAYEAQLVSYQGLLMARTALAVERCRLDIGRLPEDLAALVPHYLQEVPEDYFRETGTVTYRTAASGYTICSVGPDGKDNSGRVKPDNFVNGSGEEYDLVFQVIHR